MNERELQSLVKKELMRCGHMVTEQPAVIVGGHTYNGDLEISETSSIIEVKTQNGSWRKGIGQCISYEAAGYETALVTDVAPNCVRKTADHAGILLIQVDKFLNQARLECVANKHKMREVIPRVLNPDKYDSVEDTVEESYERYGPTLNI